MTDQTQLETSSSVTSTAGESSRKRASPTEERKPVVQRKQSEDDGDVVANGEKAAEEQDAKTSTDEVKDDDGPRKRAKVENDSDSAAAPPLDLALTLGYKEGDRIEVQWEIEDDGNVEVHWWGATLLKHDGRTTDSVAIRSLEYDSKPDLGFVDKSVEDVIFLGDDLLVSPDSQVELKYRREGEKEEVFRYNDGDLDEQLNAILMGALNKKKAAWDNLPPAQQALIAEKIATKKEKLKEVLKAQDDDVITSTTIQAVLRQAFA